VVTALLAGCALLCWPAHVPLVVVQDIGHPDGRWRVRFKMRAVVTGASLGRWVVGLIVLTGAAVWVAVGAVVACSATLLLVSIAGLTRGELRRRRALAELAELLVTVRTLAREVRSGTLPSPAVSAVSAACGGRSGLMLERLAEVVATDRGGSDALLAGAAVTENSRCDSAAEVTGRLAAGWALSARYGVPWVGLIDALAVDLDDRVRGSAARAAQVSGPRVSGYVLAAMPALGLLLGVGMGADPIRILLRTGVGNLMLLTGCTLTCAGLWWTARIVRG
jgi:tight adherence protein B